MIFVRGESMNVGKKVIILVSICLVVLVGAVIADRVLSKSYLKELKYDDVIEKLENKEDFVLLISQTQCSHCISYKPKLEDVANEHKVMIYYIDVDLLEEEDYNELNSRISFASSGTPLTIFFKDGGEVTSATRIKGDASKDKVEKKLKSNGFID